MSLPSGYKRLEYIQSTGTQYIDTGFKPNQNTRVLCEFLTKSSSTSLFGSQEAWGSKSYSFGSNTASFGANCTTSLSFNDGVKHIVDFKNNSISVDDNVLLNYSGTFQINYDMYVLANNEKDTTVYYSSAKLYSCKIYDNGTLVREFIPCQKPDGTIGLWDDVNSVFYGNAGTGAFTAGPVIAIAADASEKTKLEYIQSNGTQYIDTLFKPNNNTRVVMDAQMVGATNMGTYYLPFGVRSGGYFFELFKASTSNWNLTFLWGTTYPKYFTIDYSKRYVFEINKNTATVGSESYTYTNTTFQLAYNLYLGADNDGGNLLAPTPLRIYSCQIYDNGTLVRDFIAAKLSDGTVGLYDKLSCLLYINAGTGTFEAGPSSLNLPVNIGGTWKDANEVFVNIGGTWKTAEAAFVDIGETWKELG